MHHKHARGERRKKKYLYRDWFLSFIVWHFHAVRMCSHFLFWIEFRSLLVRLQLFAVRQRSWSSLFLLHRNTKNLCCILCDVRVNNVCRSSTQRRLSFQKLLHFEIHIFGSFVRVLWKLLRVKMAQGGAGFSYGTYIDAVLHFPESHGSLRSTRFSDMIFGQFFYDWSWICSVRWFLPNHSIFMIMDSIENIELILHSSIWSMTNQNLNESHHHIQHSGKMRESINK